VDRTQRARRLRPGFGGVAADEVEGGLHEHRGVDVPLLECFVLPDRGVQVSGHEVEHADGVVQLVGNR
jgi:hypothetical protein